MGTRRVLNIRIDMELEHYGRQIAESQLRTFPNYIESLIKQDIIKHREKGFKFVEYEEPGGNIINTKKDEKLIAIFEKFTQENP
jgi:hypothetical protein